MFVRIAAFADRIVLNKLDLVTSDELREIERRVAAINPLAPVLRTTFGAVRVEDVVGIGAFSTQRAMALMEEPESTRKHDSAVRTISFVEARPIALERFRRWLGSVLWESDERREELFRAKAVVNIVDDDKRYLMQAVHELFEVNPVRDAIVFKTRITFATELNWFVVVVVVVVVVAVWRMAGKRATCNAHRFHWTQSRSRCDDRIVSERRVGVKILRR